MMSKPPTNNFLERVSNLALVRCLLFFAFGWALLQFLTYFEIVIVIFVSAAILAFLLSYPVRWVARFLPRSFAAGLVFLLIILIVCGLVATLGLAVLSQGQQLFNRLIEFVNFLEPLVKQIEEFLRTRNLEVDLNLIAGQVRNLLLSGISYSVVILQSSLSNLLTIILILVVGFFMLLDGVHIWKFILKLLPPKRRDKFEEKVKKNFLGFFRGQLILMLFLSLTTFIVFVLLQVSFPLLLSVIVGVIDAIPGIGATLGISIVVFLILLSQNVWLALKCLIACIVLQQLQDNLIAPRVMQNTVNVNPVVIFFALIVGARIAGLLGIFLAVPIAGLVVGLWEIDEMKGDS